MKKILEHFKKVDPILYKAAVDADFMKMDFFGDENVNHFEKLCRAIVGQQLSVKAAATIYSRFEELIGKGMVTPEKILAAEEQKMRDAGMSWAKIKYVKDLAQKVLDKELHLESLSVMSDEEIVKELTAVKGIGQWTAEMYMMFTLGRPDIFSVGDLGLRRAMEKLYGLEKPSNEALIEMAKKWSPYRTYACRVLWESLDNAPQK